MSRRQHSTDHVDVVNALSNLGELCDRQERWVEAETWYRQSAAMREKLQQDEWQRYLITGQLGKALLKQQKYGEAEPLVLTCYQGMKEREA